MSIILRPIILVLILLNFCTDSWAQRDKTQVYHPYRLSEGIDSLAAAEAFNGSIYLAVGSEQVLHKCYGYKGADGRELIDKRTTYNIGSIAKNICTYALSIMIGEHHIDWNDPISKFLNGLPKWSRDISVLELVQHRGGIPSRRFRRDYTDENLWSELVGLDTLMPKKYIYSNYNNFLQAILFEALTKERLSTYVKKNVFVPNEMHSSHYSTFPPGVDSDMSRSYSREFGDDILHNPRVQYFDLNFGPIYMTVKDLSTWTMFVVNQFENATDDECNILYAYKGDLGFGPLGKFNIVEGKIVEFESGGQAYNFEVGIFYNGNIHSSLVIATNNTKRGQISRMKDFIFSLLQ